MTKKRRHDAPSVSGAPNPKRSKNFYNTDHDASQPRVDPNTGQRGALPGLDDDDDAELSDELSNDAIAYLRGVRNEALLIPPILVAPPPVSTEITQNPPHHNEYVKDPRGYYTDGAYIAAPLERTIGPHFPSSTDAEGDAHFDHYEDWEPNDDDADEYYHHDDDDGTIPADEAYHAALIARFAATCAQLARPPPAQALARLDPTRHPSTLLDVTGSNNNEASPHAEAARWRRILASEDPKPAQLAGMERGMVLRVLQVATWGVKRNKLLSDGGGAGGEEEVEEGEEEEVREDGDGDGEPRGEGGGGRGARRLGAWIWGLLGRVGHVGTLVSEDVAVVRELGKRAVRVVRGFERLAEEEEWGEGDAELEEPVEEEKWSGGVEDSAAASEAQNGTQATTRQDEDENEGANTTEAVSKPEEGSVAQAQAQTEFVDNDTHMLEAAKAQLLSSYYARIAAAESPLEALGTNATPDERDTLMDQKTYPRSRIPHTAFATLDAILTIVGECYGQRDLLEARRWLWEGQ